VEPNQINNMLRGGSHETLQSITVCSDGVCCFRDRRRPSGFFRRDIKIGFVFSMTGGAAVYGASQKEAPNWRSTRSTPPRARPYHHSIFEDDASVPQQGTNVYNKLINGDKVAAIIGPT